MPNLAVQASANHTECLKNQSHKLARQSRKDQPWCRLATINKIAQKAGYNLPEYSEKRTVAELLEQHSEYSYLTGKKLGTYYLSTLDIDIRKEEFPKKMVAHLEKNYYNNLFMENSKEKETKISNQQLINFLDRELNNNDKKREEKIAEIFAFCLDYLNQFEKEDWKKKRNNVLLLLTMAETEWKNTKKQVFESYINKEIIKSMKF